ncbi:transcriptional regulator [Serratia sp. J2]|uniref:winged helix-turn-helix domain-containing protein n=1 Tax=Serratia sp. J2 TaxID=3386551 RepID=UPI003916E07B
MPTIYIINNAVEFNAKERTLTSLEDSSNKVLLYVPAARCLMLLLKNRDTILDKNVFFNEVWNKNGVYVTANTFYQNISILRRGFLKLGLGNEVVNTIPRKGLQLSKFLDIKEITERDEEENKLKQIPEIKSENQLSIQRINKINRLTLIFILITAIFTIYFIIAGNMKNQGDFFMKYKYVKNIGECRIYTDRGTTNVDDSAKYIRIDGKSCEKYKFNYLTKHRFSKRASVIRCNKEIGEKDTNCISEYHIITVPE